MRAALVAWMWIGSSALVSAQQGVDAERVGAELAVQRAGCVRCHASASPAFAPAHGRPLAHAAHWWQDDGGAAFLQAHPGGRGAAADLAAWLRAIASPAPGPVAPPITAAAQQSGERLVRELACAACHAPAWFAALPARVDHGRLAAFLRAPNDERPALRHPPVAADEAAAVAAYLLRAQGTATAAVAGFAWQCFEHTIDAAGLPDMQGLTPVATGTAAVVDAQPATRANHVILQFDATLTVPATGEWTFTTGSDDSSWLWIDEQLVVRNEALAPHRRKHGKVQLTAGPHACRVLFTQAGGGASLELLWQGPGVARQPVPASAAMAQGTTLQSPPPWAAPDAAAVARGRAAARAERCDACHTIDDAAFAALAAPAPAKPWAELRDRACPSTPAGQAVAAMARGPADAPRGPGHELAVALQREGCLACHSRDGRGGLPPAVRQQLTEVEDLGEEGRSPPDLTAAGHRLRPRWIERVLHGEVRARPYLKVRMPVLDAASAKAWAQRFAAVDARAGDDVEPAFSTEAVQRGRELAGTAGKNCITCHTVAGHRSLGPQGMDLVRLHERTQPAWFREWLQAPNTHRPGTRMPTLWPTLDAAATADHDALRVWASLGDSAPLPRGLRVNDAVVLEAIDGPRLHGAFLKGVSARCLCVATPERAHFAFDLVDPRLVWVWRGSFVDPAATWEGRAGQLVVPKGSDWQVLPAVRVDGERRLLGQRRTQDGYPVLRVQVGDAEYEDEARARLLPGGSEVVRTLRLVRGSLSFTFAAPTAPLSITIAGVPASAVTLTAGQSVEVVYRW